MINKVNYIFLFILWIARILFAQSHLKPVNFVYSSLSLKTIDLTEQEGIGTNFKIAKDGNLIFISLGVRGFMAVDGLTYESVFEYKSNDFLSAIGVTSDAKYIFFSENSLFSVFQFVDRKELVFIKSAEFNNKVIMDIVISFDDKFAFAVGENGQIACYSIGNPQELELLYHLSTQATLINRINISKDGQWLFLGDNEQGFTLVKVEYSAIDQQTNKQTATLQIAGNGLAYWKIFECLPTSDLDYVYCTDYWNGIYIAYLPDIIKMPSSSYPIQIQFTKRSWPMQFLAPIVFSLELVSNDQYLLVCVRSLGIFIFDISNREELIFYQQIEVEGQPVQIKISPFDANIIFINKVQLNVFNQIQPNLNNQQPNLFNGHQSMIVEFYQEVFYKWRCYLSTDNQYIYSTQDYMGLVIASIQNANPYTLTFSSLIKAVPPNFVEGATITSDRKYLFNALQLGNCTLQTFDISNVDDIQAIHCLEIEDITQHAEEQALSLDETILVLSYDIGVLIIDVSNKQETKLLSYWKMGDLMIGNLAGVMITHDKHWVLGTVRGYGVFALDIVDPKNPVFLEDINTQGGEAVRASPTRNQFAYLVDGYRGIAIIDLYSLPKLNIVSRIQLKGWSNDLTAVSNDNYLLVSTMDDGQLTLIDSSNPYSMHIISMFKEGQESAQCSCFTSDFQYAFINNEYGMRIMPLMSQVIIHADIYSYEINVNNGTQTNTRLSKDTPFEVGSNIQFNFIPIYGSQGMIIDDIMYYSLTNLQMQTLPKWMSMVDDNWSLTFQVPKESLGSDVQVPVDNTIVLKSLLFLQPIDFLFNDTDVSTDLDQATHIFYQIKDQMIFIDDSGFVTKKFRFNSQVILTNVGISDQQQLNALQQKVKLKLQQSVFYNPVNFKTQSSLFFSLKNSPEIIKSPSPSIKISIEFQSKDDNLNCLFVNIPYSGCIQELSSDQQTIRLTGSTEYINNILSTNIIYYCKKGEDQADVTLLFTIVDNLNYDFIQQMTIAEATFLNYLDPITIKSNSTSLQNQFSSQFPHSEIPIETDINFSFDTNYFTQPQQNFLPISYTLLYYSTDTNDYVEVTSGYWIKIEKEQLKLYGYALSSQLSTTEQLKIVASNGYQSNEEVFFIYINLVSILYVLNIFLRIFGFLLGLFGFYKFKSHLANLAINDRTLFSDEFAVINQPFFKQILIMGDDFQIAYLLFDKYKNEFLKGRIELIEGIPKNSIQKQTMQNSIINKDINGNSTNNQANQISLEQNNNTLHMMTQSNCLQNQISYMDSLNYEIKRNQSVCVEDKKQISINSSQYKQRGSSINNNKCDKKSKEIVKRKMSYSSNLKSLMVNDLKNLKQLKRKAKHISSILSANNSNKINPTCKLDGVKHKDKIFQSRYINIEGIAQIDLLINDMTSNKIFVYYQNKKYSMDSLKPILKSKSSVFYNCLKGVACRYFLSQDHKTLHLYNYLKEYARLSSSYCYNDWYKYYFDITYTSAISSILDINNNNSNNKNHNHNNIKDDEEEEKQLIQMNNFGQNCKFQNQLKIGDDEIEEDDDDDEDDFKNSLPACKLREKLIIDILLNLGVICERSNSLDCIIEQGINPYLIRNVLQADAFGFFKQFTSYFLPSLGESIHIYPHSLKQIQALYLVPTSSCFKKRAEAESYQHFSLQMQLPQWLSAKVVRNSLIFSGTPRYSDEKIIFIKIINNSNLVIRKFRICLLKELNSSFTELAKHKKSDKIQPKFANYFHHKQHSLKQVDADIVGETLEDKQLGYQQYAFQNYQKQEELNLSQQSHQLSTQDVKDKNLKIQNMGLQLSDLPNVMIGNNSKFSEMDSQMSKEEMNKSMLMLEYNSSELQSVNQTIVPIFPFGVNKQKLSQSYNLDASTFNYNSQSINIPQYSTNENSLQFDKQE